MNILIDHISVQCDMYITVWQRRGRDKDIGATQGRPGQIEPFGLFSKNYVLDTWLGKAAFYRHAHNGINMFQKCKHRQHDQVDKVDRMAILTFDEKTLLSCLNRMPGFKSNLVVGHGQLLIRAIAGNYIALTTTMN